MGKLCRLYFLLALVLLVTPLLVACGDSPVVVPAATPTAITTTAPATAAPTVVALPTAAPTTVAAINNNMVSPTPLSTTSTTPVATLSTLPQALAFQTFTSKEGNFSVDFPGKPKTSDNSITVMGESTTSYHFWITTDHGPAVTFEVDYTDYSKGTVNTEGPDGLLNQEIKNLSISVTGKASGIKDIQLGQLKGKEFTIDEPTKSKEYDRVYVKGNRTYSLLVEYPTTFDLSKESQTFFNSFQLLDVAMVTATATAASDPAANPPAEVKLDQVFYDSTASELKAANVTNPTVSFYASASDKAGLARSLDSEIIKNGYAARTARPTAQDSQLYVIYSKAGQPDLLFSINSTPGNLDDVKTLWSSLDLTANQTAITRMLEQVKGTKSMAVVVTANGLFDTLNKAKLAPDALTPVATVSPEGKVDAEIQDIPVDSELQSALLNEFPNADQLTAMVYASNVDIADIVSDLDASLKSHGYKSAVPGQTGPAERSTSVYTSYYTAAGLPDVAFIAIKVPEDATDRLTNFSSMGISDTSAQKYADLFKGKQSVIFVISGPDVVKNSLNK